jgi:hypothetical protein
LKEEDKSRWSDEAMAVTQMRDFQGDLSSFML